MTHEALIAGDCASLTMLRLATKLQSKPGDCGIDLYPQIEDFHRDVNFTNLGYYIIWSIPTQVSILTPPGHFALVIGRSSQYDALMGCEVLLGIIDHGYTGEYRIRVRIPVEHGGGKPMMLNLMQKLLDYSKERKALAQAIMIPYVMPSLSHRDELPLTGRGTDGYGSTDKLSIKSSEGIELTGNVGVL